MDKATKPCVVLIGFLNTKLPEYQFVRELLVKGGCEVITVDTSLKEHAAPGWVTHRAKTVYPDPDAYPPKGPRNGSLKLMAKGATKTLYNIYATTRVHAYLGLGGSTSTSLICEAFRSIPIGVPKVCVSTMASGDVSVYIGDSDIIIVPSVVDSSGFLNQISQKILSNVSFAVIGMASGRLREEDAETANEEDEQKRPKRIAVTMFGLTTPCVTAVCDRLRNIKLEDGVTPAYEPVVFHATGAGGRSMERLISEKWFDATMDITTTELADEVCGGVLTAGPTRLTAAGDEYIPQVVCLGALDMVNFGPMHTVPAKYKDRLLHVHNAEVTIMRTNKEECRLIGEDIAGKLRKTNAPVKVVCPTKGFSGIDSPKQPFWDPEADEALIGALSKGLEGSDVGVVRVDANINDEGVAVVLVESLLELLKAEK